MTQSSSNETGCILIADDDPTTRYMLRKALTQMGYTIAEAANGQACIDAYKANIPDLVLVDACMPGNISGFDCCSQLKRLPGGEHVPVLMITGLEDEASVDRAFDAGAADYVTKPIHWPVLKQRVKAFIRQARLQRQLEEANIQLKALASTDEATGLANYRVFQEQLNTEWRRLMREKAPLSLLLIDIDFFKRYNDAYGHVAGNHSLRQVASAIQKVGRRPADLAARYGGEEFALLLPRTPLAGAEHIARTIQQAIAQLKIDHKDSEASAYLTVSIGAACLTPPPKFTEVELVTMADTALYQAKAAGRNQVVCNCG